MGMTVMAEAGGGSVQAGAVERVGEAHDVGQTGTLEKFEGFLKAVGHMAGIALADVVRYALPLAAVVSSGAVPLPAAEQAFAASLVMVVNAVVLIEQKWGSMGPGAGPQKLADVLEMVTEPILLLFSQAGYAVDARYVMSLVNGVVALLNAQPAAPVLGGAPVLAGAPVQTAA